MSKRARSRSAAPSSVEADASLLRGQDDNAMVGDTPDTGTQAAASDDGRSNNRREAFARIARSRASFFALGGGSGRDQTRVENEETASPSWPGPFSTGRELIAGRDEARRIREAGEAETRDGGDIVDEDLDATCSVPALAALHRLGVSVRDFQSSWSPTLMFSADTDASATTDVSTAQQQGGSGASRRRAIAVAGPSGVRLEVPALTTLCMEVRCVEMWALLMRAPKKVRERERERVRKNELNSCTAPLPQALAMHLSHVESLDCLPADLRRRFAAIACR